MSSFMTPIGTPLGTPIGTPIGTPFGTPTMTSKDIFDKFEIKADKGITYYIIPAGTDLYHGSDVINNIADMKDGQHTFFAVTTEYAATYAKKTGNIFHFTTKKDIQLVAMDKPNKTLYKNADADIKKIMDTNYGFQNEHKRKSEQKSDNALSAYLCKTGYNGYAAGEMKGVDFTFDLDPEIIICHVNQLQYKGTNKNNLNREIDGPKKQKQPIIFSQLNFMNDGYETPGGKKKRQKVKTTKRKIKMRKKKVKTMKMKVTRTKK
jgi:hypothetical protein